MQGVVIGVTNPDTELFERNINSRGYHTGAWQLLQGVRFRDDRSPEDV